MNFTASIIVDQTPAQAFAAITNVRGWWSEVVEGNTSKQGDVFVFEVPDVHRCTLTLTEVVADKKIVWRVSDCYIAFVADKAEWDDTEIVFEVSEKDGKTEVRFTHVGLVPAYECFDVCSDAWGSYITGSLRSLITTGKGDPYRESGTFETEVLKHQMAVS
jgi:hypothetical protein